MLFPGRRRTYVWGGLFWYVPLRSFPEVCIVGCSCGAVDDVGRTDAPCAF